MLQAVFTMLLALMGTGAFAQRVYRTQSVLATGNWYKIAVNRAGVQRVDVPALAAMGINTGNLASAAIRLFGNGGAMIPENNTFTRPDDLEENALWMEDGGDGLFNGNDYFLFFAPGPDHWEKDSLNKRFNHRKNLYTGEAFYFITIGGSGKRVATATPAPGANITVNSFQERYFYENELVNLLSSGREWLGEEFSANPGQQLSRSFTIPFRHVIINQPLTLHASVASRSGGSGGRFTFSSGANTIMQVNTAPVSGNPLDLFATPGQQAANYTGNQPQQQDLLIAYTPGGANAQGWLNWFELHGRCRLDFSGYGQLLFRDWSSVATGNIANYQVQNAPNSLQVWDVTNPLEPVRQTGTLNGGVYSFNQDAGRLREYVAFDGSAWQAPVFKEIVPPQNLHQGQPADLIIVTHPLLAGAANRLANHHVTRDNMAVKVVTTTQVYNEFGGGNPDPGAIRDLVKMYYDKYRTSAQPLKYLLLLGDASFDYRDRVSPNTNLAPAWQSPNYYDPLQTYVSDDFFGLLDDADDINNPSPALLDVGIGRVPARTAAEANSYADKVLAYHTPAAFGPWRNQLTLVADDEDGNLHLNDAEALANTLQLAAPGFVKDKLYLDAYRQESGAGGSRYPAVNEAINNKILNGTLVWNYSGHGGDRRLADEAILDADMISDWKNEYRLPLFITATCDFAPYDDPLRFSIGESILLQPKSGAIALMTTTRVVFAFANRVMNDNYLRYAFQPQAGGRYATLGEATRLAKNYTYTTSTDIVNNRKFTLLGDPALTLAFPRYRIATTYVNGQPYTPQADTVKATNLYTLAGEVRDESNNLLSGFNGTVYPVVYDRPRQVNTLVNDPGSVLTSFQVPGNILFKGKASVANGRFSFSFIAPKDMQYATGNGSVVYYGNDAATDGQGTDVLITGGNGSGNYNDNEGPVIKAWLNDDKFINGGLTNSSPVLIVSLYDTSGINTSGAGVGHEITAVLDNDTRRTFVLNEFYEASLNSYRSGQLRFQLPDLDAGPHQLRIKAWDVLNNSNEAVLEFTAGAGDRLQLAHVLNYPNPFTTKTTFWFEHNRPGENLLVNIHILSIGGKRVRSIRRTINTPGYRSCEIEWDGRDDYGDRLARGVYIYHLNVQSPDGQKVLRTEKILIL